MIAARKIAVALGLAAASTLLIATPAHADTLTSTYFVGERAVSAPFGSDWLLTVAVSPVGGGVANSVGPTDGTLSVLVDGAPFIAELPVNPGGLAFIAQPASAHPLPAGDHEITAVFTPTAGGEYGASRTGLTTTLTITPLSVTPIVEIVTAADEVAVPTVRTSFAGEYVTELGAPPAGEWRVTVTNDAGDEVFSQTARQPTQSADGEIDPLDLPITARLDSGATYSVDTEFVADSSIATGLTFDAPEPLALMTADLTIAEKLVEPVAMPLWAIIALIAAPLVALLTVVALGLALRRRRSTLRESEPITGVIEVDDRDDDTTDETGEIVIEDEASDRGAMSRDDHSG